MAGWHDDALCFHRYKQREVQRDQYYTPMLTTIVRVGPLLLLEIIFAVAAIACALLYPQHTCYYYSLGQIADVIFIIETIFALALIKRHPPLQQVYIIKRALERKSYHYLRKLWDNLNVAVAITILASATVKDAITIARDVDDEFTLAPLCLAISVTKQGKGEWDFMMLWLLFGISVLTILILSIVLSRQYANYSNKITHNRRLRREFTGEMRQTLLDSTLMSGQEAGGEECAICLHRVGSNEGGGERAVLLRCGHCFHQECIQRWLVVKDGCPYRCQSPLQ